MQLQSSDVGLGLPLDPLGWSQGCISQLDDHGERRPGTLRRQMRYSWSQPHGVVEKCLSEVMPVPTTQPTQTLIQKSLLVTFPLSMLVCT